MYLKTNLVERWLIKWLAIAIVPLLLTSCQKDVTTKAINNFNSKHSLGGLIGNWSLQKIKNVERTNEGITIKTDSVSLNFESSEKLLIKQDYLTISNLPTPYTIEGTKDNAIIKYLTQREYTLLKVNSLSKSEMILEKNEPSQGNYKTIYLYFNRF